MNHLPYLLPWVRVLLLIRSITSTTWGHEAWPHVKPVVEIPIDPDEFPTPVAAVRRDRAGARA